MCSFHVVASVLSFNNLKYHKTKAVKKICMQEKNHTLVSSINRLPKPLALVKTIKQDTRFQLAMQGLKVHVMLTNLQNERYFNNLGVRKISTSKCL